MIELHRQLLLIISSQLFFSTCEVSCDQDLRVLLEEAQQQAVFQIAYMGIGVDNYDAEAMKRFYSDKANSIRNLQQHKDLHKLLSSENIPYIILKGQASAMYYPDPLLRSMGDVDFLVDRENIDIVGNLLINRGYSLFDSADSHEHHWVYRKGNSSFELHWEIPGVPQGDTVISRYMSKAIEEGYLYNDSFRVPSAFHHGIILLVHTISHMTGRGVGLRHLCDWLVFQNSIEEAEFVSMFEQPLKEMGLWRFAQVMTKIGVMYFGCGSRNWCKDASDDVCAAFLDDILKGGNFGVKDGTRKSQAKLIQNRSKKTVSQRSVLHNGLVSINEKAKRDYPVMRKVKVLLPLGWIIVGAQYLFRVITGRRNNVFNKRIYSEVKARQELYSQFRLFEPEAKSIKTT